MARGNPGAIATILEVVDASELVRLMQSSQAVHLKYWTSLMYTMVTGSRTAAGSLVKAGLMRCLVKSMGSKHDDEV